MSTKTFIADLTPKSDVDTLFLVKYLAIQEARDGKKYLNVVLTDSTGDLESRSWSDAEEIAGRVSKNDFVRARGKINMFQGRRQLILSAIERVSEKDVKVSDFVARSEFDPEGMYRSLLDLVAGLKDAYIRELLTLVLSDPEISRRLKTWPAGKTIHHAYQSGLLEHVLSCARLSLHLSGHYRVNENYVVAGAILHDLCKVFELSEGYNVEYTEEGKLVGHLVKGVELLEKFANRIPHFPSGMRMHLKHILLSHHGEYAYGSPKIPQTSEAFLVHLVDLMDSKMNAMEMVKRTDNQAGPWSGFVKHLDRIVYKADLPFYSQMLDEKPVSEGKVGSMGKLLQGYKPGQE